MKEIIDIVHKSILPFFDVCEDGEEPQSDKDKLLLKVNKAICNNLKALEQKQKTGHWRPIYQGGEIIGYRCSECEFGKTRNTHRANYCHSCGARMVESQERSDKE